MRKTCAEAVNQLRKWNGISDEWNDNKRRDIETEYIDPMQVVLDQINEKCFEVDAFITETEERINEIKEDIHYG